MHTKRCGRKIVTLTLILTLIILVLLQQLLNTDKGWRNDFTDRALDEQVWIPRTHVKKKKTDTVAGVCNYIAHILRGKFKCIPRSTICCGEQQRDFVSNNVERKDLWFSNLHTYRVTLVHTERDHISLILNMPPPPIHRAFHKISVLENDTT